MEEKFMKLAAEEAAKGVSDGDGGPFGALIVRAGKIISQAHNCVISTPDPTAHAELLAIRIAAEKLGRFDLSDCEIYASCEPCPMCLAAILWARIPKLYYGASREDAAAAGFDDAVFYERMETMGRPALETKQCARESCLEAFAQWNKKNDRIDY